MTATVNKYGARDAWLLADLREYDLGLDLLRSPRAQRLALRQAAPNAFQQAAELETNKSQQTGADICLSARLRLGPAPGQPRQEGATGRAAYPLRHARTSLPAMARYPALVWPNY